MWPLTKDVKVVLEKHVKELKDFGFLPDNWFWHRDQIRALDEIDRKLINDLIDLHKKHATNPKSLSKLYNELKSLAASLKELCKIHLPDITVQRREAELVNGLVNEITSLLDNIPTDEATKLPKEGKESNGIPEPSKIIIDTVKEPGELLIRGGEYKEIRIDDEDMVEHGQILTKSLASCVGYAVYIPKEARAYVGHFNGIPNELMCIKNEGGRKFLELGISGEMLIFIFGGDGEPIADTIIRKLIGMLDLYGIRGLPVFCEVSSSLYRLLAAISISSSFKAIVLPKVSGICIDTVTGKIRLLIPEPSANMKESLRKIMPEYVEVV